MVYTSLNLAKVLSLVTSERLKNRRNTGTDGNTGSDGSGQTDSTAGTDDVNGADNGKGASASGTGNAQNKNADDSSAAGAVKTGDSVNPIIYAVFMAAAMAAVMVTLRGKKRR